MHGSPQHRRRANGLLELCSPGHVNEDEQDGVKDERKKEDRMETERQIKFKLKFKVIYLHSPSSRQVSKDFKGTDQKKRKKRKKDGSKKKKSKTITSN